MLGKISKAFNQSLVLIVRLYRMLRSRRYPCCRYHPSCSQYAIDALRRHNFIKALFLIGWRLLRCNPWSDGGYDPVPPVKNKKTC